MRFLAPLPLGDFYNFLIPPRMIRYADMAAVVNRQRVKKETQVIPSKMPLQNLWHFHEGQGTQQWRCKVDGIAARLIKGQLRWAGNTG